MSGGLHRARPWRVSCHRAESWVSDSGTETSIGLGGRNARCECVPRIAVLLATHDGAQFVRDQVDSILRQQGVAPEVVVSDDGSTDGTWELLQEWARTESRLRLLPRERKFGGAAPNFYHLLLSVDPVAFDAIALADQDDVWEDWRLEYHLSLLREHGVGGVSSSVLAFWPDGRERVVEKAGAMRRFDHLFQSPGPGCTFLLTPALTGMVRTCLSHSDLGASNFVFHDWLIYAIARSCGFGWHISDRPSLRYRQHGSNEWGANFGMGAIKRRMQRLVDGTYRQWASNVLRIARGAATLCGALPPPERVSAVQIALEGRRRFSDRMLIAATHPLGIRAATSVYPGR